MWQRKDAYLTAKKTQSPRSSESQMHQLQNIELNQTLWVINHLVPYVLLEKQTTGQDTQRHNLFVGFLESQLLVQ